MYEAISVIEFKGSINAFGESHGHYICDLQEAISNSWFRTNDNHYPVPINQDQVTSNAYVILMKRSN